MLYILDTAWKVSKYGVFSGPYFAAFWSNTGKYGPEKTQYLDTCSDFIRKSEQLSKTFDKEMVNVFHYVIFCSFGLCHFS